MTFVLPFPNIDPVLIELVRFGNFPIAIRWYGLLWIFGCLLAWWNARNFCEKYSQNVTKKDIDDFLVWGVLATVVGGRIGYALFYSDENFNIFLIWQGGLSFHGGFLGVVLAIIFYTKYRAVPIWQFSDAIACSAPIGLCSVRIANFINGELYGRVTTMPWGMVFPGGGSQPRHPSQLYEAFFEGIVLFVVLYMLSLNKKVYNRVGLLTGIFMVGYALARGAVEIFRQPDAHLGFLAGGMTMGQWLSAPVLVFGLYLILRPHKTYT